MKLTLLILFFCSTFVELQSKDLFNRKQSKVNSFGNTWDFVSDNVMGGLSEGQYQFLLQNNEKFYRLHGTVSTENNGGFIQLRSKINFSDSSYTGIKIKVRGDKGNYSLHFRTGYTILPWQYYNFDFNVSDEWQVIKIPFKMFEKSHFFQPTNLTVNDLSSIAFVAIGLDFKAKLDISEASFY